MSMNAYIVHTNLSVSNFFFALSQSIFIKYFNRLKIPVGDHDEFNIKKRRESNVAIKIKIFTRESVPQRNAYIRFILYTIGYIRKFILVNM